MAARLKWWRGYLRLGQLVLARVGENGGLWTYRLSKPAKWGGEGDDAKAVPSDPYERKRDCMADCESEVRRLLKAAGVEVE
jgi:hypothetical protein